MRRALLIAFATVTTGCNEPPIPVKEPFVPPETPPSEAELLAARAYSVKVPASYDGGTAVPLVIALHGYAGSGAEIVDYYGLDRLMEQRGFLLIAPTALKDSRGNPAWHVNKTSWPEWDPSWLTAVIHDAKSKWNVDAARVFMFGASQGAHMAHRMACDGSADVTGIASIAGQVTKDPEGCQPTRLVTVLQIHGTADETIGYYGDLQNVPPNPTIPSAHDTVATWARNDGCTGQLLEVAGSPVDLSLVVAGAETKLEQYEGCPTGIDVALWTMNDVPHRPLPTDSFSARIMTFLNARPRP